MSDVVWCEVAREVVTVSGPDAVSFLHGQLSQDITGLAVGASAWSFVLLPTGKVSSLVRVWRRATDVVDLDVDLGHGAALVARLNRFRLRVKLEITLPAAVTFLALRGPEAVDLAATVGGNRLVSWWGEDDATDVVGATSRPPTSAVLVPVDSERLRIEAGWPAMGHELDEDVIPAESGLVALAVSFTKGCYTGQELTARIDSRGGNVPRHLRRLRSSGPLSCGDGVTVDGKDVGRITSVVGTEAGAVALGYVARSVVPPEDVTVAGHPTRVELIRP